MIRRAFALALALSLMVLQSALFSFLPIESSKPDIAVPYIIYATFFLSPFEGLITAFIVGFAEEMLSVGPHGALIFTKVFLFLSCIFLRSRLYIESQYLFAAISSCFVLLESALFIALAFLGKGEAGAVMTVLKFSLPNAVFTAVLALFLFPVFERLKLRPYGVG
ncbi:MAG TPA: rod shape-determining protein MreD [Syntrophorhabdales bacterium]|nr:rod shape-determining protein MreD [Syntrophorhabdales bacterium]